MAAFSSSAFSTNAFSTSAFDFGTSPTPTPVTGGHFLPRQGNRKATLSNILTIYKEAKKLPRKQTKELRDAIAEFVEPVVAKKAVLPDYEKINYEALQANQIAYEKFITAIDNIQNQMVKYEYLQKQDDELLLIAIISCTLH